MNAKDLSFQHDLIGYVLDTLDEDERAVFEARLLREPGLTEQVNALRRTLQPLDTWETEEPSASAVDDIMTRVETTSPLEYLASSTSIAPDPTAQPARRKGPGLRDVLALAACILILIGVYVPSMAHKRARQLQSACGVNMAGFGAGASQYATANNDRFPRGTQAPNWLQQPSRMRLAPIIRLRIVSPQSVFCPTSPGTAPDAAAIYKDPEAFLKNVRIRFYSLQNMNGPLPRSVGGAAMPIMGDPNPMIGNGRFNPSAHRNDNSDAHKGKGQNVLFLDGSVKFLSTPVIRGETDNIWQAGNVQKYTGTETPQSATDAFLIP